MQIKPFRFLKRITWISVWTLNNILRNAIVYILNNLTINRIKQKYMYIKSMFDQWYYIDQISFQKDRSKFAFQVSFYTFFLENFNYNVIFLKCVFAKYSAKLQNWVNLSNSTKNLRELFPSHFSFLPFDFRLDNDSVKQHWVQVDPLGIARRAPSSQSSTLFMSVQVDRITPKPSAHPLPPLILS